MATVQPDTDTDTDTDTDPPVQGWRRIPRTYRVAGFVMLLATVMASLFALSYGFALGRPQPRDIPIATVGPPARAAALVGRLQATTDGGLRVSPYASVRSAENAIERQRVYAIVDVRTADPMLLISSASGTSVSRTLQQLVQQLPRSEAVRVRDLNSLPSSDPQGLITFYVTIAATILGFVTMFQLRANLDDVPLRDWVGFVATLAVVGGAVLAAMAELVLRALSGPYLELWAVLAVQVAIAALFNSAMLLFIGRWAIMATWTLFILLGNSSSGGAVAPPLLPAGYAFLSRYLPSGATVSALHTAVYFRGFQRAEPFVVLAAWLVATLVALLVLGRVRGRSPAD